MKNKAVKTIIEFARKRLEESPISEQIVFFRAVAEVAPTEEDRAEAHDIAHTLSVVSARQLEFTNRLLGGLQ